MIRFTFSGTEEVQARIKVVQEEFTLKLQNALRDELEDLAGKCRDATPVDTGALRDGIHVEMTGPLSGMVTTDPGQDEYAMIVHEDMEARHSVGGPKYIERPLNEAMDGMPQRIAEKAKI